MIFQFVSETPRVTAADIQHMIEVFAPQLAALAGAWGLVPPELTAEPRPGARLVRFVPASTSSGLLGYHDRDGVSYVAVDLILEELGTQVLRQVAVAAFHEVAEVLVDPGAGEWVESDGVEYAKEVVDPVQRYHIAHYCSDWTEVWTCNWVTPAWFGLPTQMPPELAVELGLRPDAPWFDFLGVCGAPFEVYLGGYVVTRKVGDPEVRFASFGVSRWQQDKLQQGLHRRQAGYTKLGVNSNSKRSADMTTAEAREGLNEIGRISNVIRTKLDTYDAAKPDSDSNPAINGALMNNYVGSQAAANHVINVAAQEIAAIAGVIATAHFPSPSGGSASTATSDSPPTS